MEFTQFEKQWLIELVEEKYAEFEQEKIFFEEDKNAFISILKKLKEN